MRSTCRSWSWQASIGRAAGRCWCVGLAGPAPAGPSGGADRCSARALVRARAFRPGGSCCQRAGAARSPPATRRPHHACRTRRAWPARRAPDRRHTANRAGGPSALRRGAEGPPLAVAAPRPLRAAGRCHRARRRRRPRTGRGLVGGSRPGRTRRPLAHRGAARWAAAYDHGLAERLARAAETAGGGRSATRTLATALKPPAGPPRVEQRRPSPA